MTPNADDYDRIRHTQQYQEALAAGLAVLQRAADQRKLEIAELERLFKLNGEC